MDLPDPVQTEETYRTLVHHMEETCLTLVQTEEIYLDPAQANFTHQKQT